MGQSTLIIGAGNMGGALLSGWLSASIITPRNVAIFDPSPGVEAVYALERGAKHLSGCEDISRSTDTVLLAIKPQMFPQIARDLNGRFGEGVIVLSIMAGISTDTLEKAFPDAVIVRAMPNTPASVGKGITAFYTNAELDEVTLDRVQSLLSATGQVVRVQSDSQINAVTAISGSGPAYLFHVCETLTTAGKSLGLDPEVAAILAEQTVIGASALLEASDRSPQALREAVTSPGGTTQAALSVLMDSNRLQSLMQDAVEAAFARAEELSDK